MKLFAHTLKSLLLLIVLTAVFTPVAAQSPNYKTRVCSCTTGSQFAWHAENAALNEFPFLVQGAQDIYVVNPHSQDVRVFTVRRQMVGSSPGFDSEFWTTEVVPGIGDQATIGGLHAVITAVGNFDASIQRKIRLADQTGPLVPSIGSAADLVGPEDSPASLNRRALNNWLSDLMSREFNDAVEAAEAGDFGDSLLEDFSGTVQAILEFLGPNPEIWIEFSDGTQVKSNLESTGSVINIDGLVEGMSFEYKVDPTTAQGPGLPAVPQSRGQLGGFGYSGSGIGGLHRLGLLLGARYTYGDGNGGGGCEGTMTCTTVGDDIECHFTLSKAQVEAC